MGMSLMSSFWSRTRCRRMSGGPSKTSRRSGTSPTGLAEASPPCRAGSGLSSDPDSVANLRHFGASHLPRAARAVGQDLAHGDAAFHNPQALFADGGEDLLHPFEHPLFALDASDARGAAPRVHLGDRRLVGKDPVIGEDVADLGVPAIGAPLPRRVGDHRL